jgi:hypothetical protein
MGGAGGGCRHCCHCRCQITYDEQIRRLWKEIRGDWLEHERLLAAREPLLSGAPSGSWLSPTWLWRTRCSWRPCWHGRCHPSRGRDHPGPMVFSDGTRERSSPDPIPALTIPVTWTSRGYGGLMISRHPDQLRNRPVTGCLRDALLAADPDDCRGAPCFVTTDALPAA